MHLRSLLQPLLLSVALATAAASTVHAAPPPVEHFFALPKLADPQLSPSGRFVAVKVAAEGKRGKLVVLEPGTDRPAVVVAQFANTDIGRVQWVNEQRLLFDTIDRSVAQGDRTRAPGLFAVNADGSNVRQLADVHGAVSETGSRIRPAMLSWNHFFLDERGPQDSNSAYLLRGEADSANRFWLGWSLVKVDTTSASSTQVAGPGHVKRWLLDYAGQPRLALRQEEGMVEVHILDADTGKWRQLATFPAYGVSPGAFEPLAFGPDGTLYVKGNRGDTSAVFALDTKTGKLAAEPLVNTPGYDFDGKLVFGSMNRGGLAGASFELDDRFTGYDARGIREAGLDGGKMLLRIDPADPASGATIEACSHAVDALADVARWAMVEPFMSTRADGRVRNDLTPDAVIRSIAIASGLGRTSAYTWLKLPVVDDMERVLAASTMPALILGGEVSRNADAAVAKWAKALQLPAVRGLVIGRSLLYPPGGDVAAAVDEAVSLL